jgi:exopolysaccharide biosynthesis predicted pyruvyltransferase EpsI
MLAKEPRGAGAASVVTRICRQDHELALITDYLQTATATPYPEAALWQSQDSDTRCIAVVGARIAKLQANYKPDDRIHWRYAA